MSNETGKEREKSFPTQVYYNEEENGFLKSAADKTCSAQQPAGYAYGYHKHDFGGKMAGVSCRIVSILKDMESGLLVYRTKNEIMVRRKNDKIFSTAICQRFCRICGGFVCLVKGVM